MEKRYNNLQAEKETQRLWQEQKTYSVENNPGKLYSIDTPPPTVSGNLHIGHIFSYTQTDIIARYKRMSGFSVFYPFGFDDNGLPTERYIEKKLKIRAHELSRSELIKTCLKVTHEVEETFKQLWQKMGLSCDWDICYSTISNATRKVSQESFIRLYNKGAIYRKHEPALFCTTCRTSVAQAELDDEEHPSFFNDIIFKTEDGKNLLIGTTRPELLPSCVALLYNPNDERYKHLKGKKAISPIFEQQVPILEDEKVEIEKGTGLVMVCTFGDTTDIEWYKKFKFPYKQSIDFGGKFLPHTGILAGLKVAAARKKIIEVLKEKNLLIRQKEITHTVNVHERCKKSVEIIALPQWFLNILDNKEQFIELADNINWYPTYMKTRYLDWVKNLEWDWCLSRQRFYGIPFPAWHCNDCDKILLAQTKDLPIDPTETEYHEKKCSCGSTNIKPDTDIMDTWNTSSLTPQILYNYFNKDSDSAFTDEKIKEFIPMSMRPQAHDIIRTWAFYTIIKSWLHHNTIPWKDIVVSGHVLSGKNVKLSKSKNNASMAPETLLQNYSADAIRYWTASGGLGKDIAFSEPQLKVGQKLTTKLWNAFKFIKTHIEDIHIDQEQNISGIANKWILHNVSSCFENYKKYFDKHEFSLALQSIESFFWAQFCDNYLEMVKDQLFNPDNYDKQTINSTRWTLHHVGLRILQMYGPFVPHITEHLYHLIFNKEKTNSLHQTQFTNLQKQFSFSKSLPAVTSLLEIITQVRKLKSEHQLSLKAEIESVSIFVENKEIEEQLKSEKQLLAGTAKTKEIIFLEKKVQKSEIITEDDNHKIIISL